MTDKENAKRHWETVQKLTSRGKKDDDVDGTTIVDTLESNQEDLIVRHGIYLSERMSFNGVIKNVVFNSITQQLLVLYEDMRIFICHQNGERQIFASADLLDGFIFVPKTNRYIAWSKDGRLRVLDSKLIHLSTIPVNSEVFCLVYNTFGEELITGNKGLITVWIFRSGNTLLVPRNSIRNEIGANEEVQLLTVEETSSKNQRCFAVVQNSVYIFAIKSGKYLEKLQNLHKTCITGIMYFRPLRLLITSGQDGSIKTWGDNNNLKTVFVGHTKSVNQIMLYRYGPLFLSISNDDSLRIWNLDTSDEVEVISVNSKFIGMNRYSTEDSFYTYTKSMIYLWKLNNVHSLVTAVGSRVKAIKSTTHPNISKRSILICKDSCVRITCPKSGTVITVCVLPEGTIIQDAVYAISSNVLFTLLNDGTIMKSVTNTNPCKILEKWERTKTGAPSKCQLLCLYEYVVENQLTGNKWTDVTLEARGKKYAEEKAEVLDDGTIKVADNYDRIILFGACKDGTVVVYEWQHSKRSGKVSFVLQAHSDDIIAVTANPKSNQIITAGADMTIKIWRVFPFAQEALAPLILYMNSETVTHLAVDERRLCVAFQEKSVAAYTITMYRTKSSQRGRIDHLPDDEHTDVIISVSACAKLRIFASASIDGTIRIWNEANKLVRVIKLNTVPHSMCFCTQRGDILVAIGNHVHKIPHKAYLPTAYLYQMAVMMFNDPPGEVAIPVTQEALATLSMDEKTRLLKAHSSLFKVSQFVDDLPDDEMKEREEEHSLKLNEYTLLEARDNELEMLVNGTYPKKRRPPASRSAKNDAWDKYLELFYKREKIKLPDERFDFDDNFIKEIPKKFSGGIGETGFFSISAKASNIYRQSDNVNESPPIYKDSRSLSISAINDTSDIVCIGKRESMSEDDQRAKSAPSKRNLVDSEKVSSTEATDQEKEEKKKEKSMRIEVKGALDKTSNAETLYELSKKITDTLKEESRQGQHKGGKLPLAPDGYLPNSVVIALYRELDRKENDKEEEVDTNFKPKQLTAAQLAELTAYKKKKQPKPVVEEEREIPPPSSKYFDMFKGMKSSDEDDLDSLLSPSISPSPPATPESDKPLPNDDIIEVPKKIVPLRPIVKLIAPVEKPKTPEVEEVPTPPPPTPPPPPPLPDFIQQFIDERWFKRCFEVSHIKETLMSWTLPYFIQKLIENMKKQENYDTKTEICEALLVLKQQHNIDEETDQMVEGEMHFFLGQSMTAPSKEKEKKFVMACLKVLLLVTTFKLQTIIELMVQHVLGNMEIRFTIMCAFEKLGLKDPAGFFARQLALFSTHSVPESRQKDHLKEQCSDWLNTWMDAFQRHIKSLAGKLYRAHKGNVVRGTKPSSTPERLKGILKEKQKFSGGKQGPRNISFVSENFTDDAAKNASPIEAINYFCEVQREAELQRLRDSQLESEKKEPKQRTKDTVLLLPRLDGYSSLARLGETHQSVCHPERETGLSYDLRLQQSRHQVTDISVKNVLLHLKTLTLNPFPDILDELLYDPYGQSSLLTLRSAKKYYVPSSSYVQEFT